MQAIIKSSPQNALSPVLITLCLGVTCLIASEFIPVSLLSIIAEDLEISKGTAGQTVTAVGIVSFFSSLFLSSLFKNQDRRTLLLLLLAILVVSNLIIAFAFNAFSLFLGRALLGISVGGFWSLSNALVQRLIVPGKLAQGFSTMLSGVSIATIIALPCASCLSLYISWRTIFILVAIVSAFTFIALFLTLPSLLPKQSTGIKVIKELISTKIVFFGLLGTFLSYMGYHVIFTYIRLFFEEKLHFTDEFLTFAMLLYAGLNIAGTIAAGKLFSHAFKRFFRLLPVFMILCVILMLVLNNSLFMALPLFAFAFGFGLIPVAWSLWAIYVIPDKTESAGGLSVAVIQLAVAFAALIGGRVYDWFNLDYVLYIALAIEAVLFWVTGKSLSMKIKSVTQENLKASESLS